MKTQRRFRPEFKRQVIEELLSGIRSPAQMIRRYEISSGLLYHLTTFFSSKLWPRGTAPKMMNYRLAFAPRRLRMRRFIISTPTEKTREK